MIIRIHNGDNEADPIICDYEAVGSFEQCEAGARVKCSSKPGIDGKRVYVRFINREMGISTTRIFNLV
ncbi:hypothetical protein LCGC14_1009450 [marine sediment metagenome]|uniref:Uncharacterized protein n=1 Tax=marine sediment metagenome TaxID=412755 RepID=A0A0F9QJ04_9ZZZZ|nr:hypothetical protein [Candidatus Aminicenantes bacterium]